MVGRARPSEAGVPTLRKAPTGIAGLDQVTNGGLPAGRTTIVCGGPGSGKTLLAMEFLVRGAEAFGEPGVLVSFEESTQELAQDGASLGFDLPRLVNEGRLAIDHVAFDGHGSVGSGDFSLEGLFLRIGLAVDRIGAKRLVLDTPEALFARLPDRSIVRSEFHRLFDWIKARGLTAVLTAERGERSLTREGLEEYVSDCVILLDQRVEREAVTRRLHIVKYRGSGHSSNEFPFLIDGAGFSVIPITGSKLDHGAPHSFLSMGVKELDGMLGGQGPYRSSSILLSGPAGTGKSTFAASFIEAACRRGERAMYVSFEESPATLMRDLASVGIDLATWDQNGLLRFHCSRVTSAGLEMHVALLTRAVREHRPAVVVIDPISAFDAIAEPREARNMVTMLADMLRAEGVTALMTYLVHDGGPLEATVIGISSTVDVWLVLRTTEVAGARRQTLHVLKARGIANSTAVRPYRLTSNGITFDGPADGAEARR